MSRAERVLHPDRSALDRFGYELRKLRKERGYSLARLAGLVYVSEDLIHRVEVAERRPSRELAGALDKALGAGGSLLTSWQDFDVEHRARKAVVLGCACGPSDECSPPTSGQNREAGNNERAGSLSWTDEGNAEDVIDVLKRVQALSRAVDPEIIRHLRGNLWHTLARYEQLDHASLVPVLLKQRSWTDSLLGECSHPKQRQQLFEIAGVTSGLLGYVAVGRSEFPLARAYCLEAFKLGDFAQDTNIQAWARGLQSFCEYYDRRYDEALRLAIDGLNYAQSGPQSVRLTINGVARARGKLGDAEGVRRAVDRAYDLMSRNDVPSGLPSSIALECYSVAQTASNAATAYVPLGMPENVQHYVEQALPDIRKSGSPWSRSLVMIDLAFSLIRSTEADLDRAAELVIDALSISEGRPIVSVQQRTSEFVRDATDRWGKIRQVSAICDAASTLEVR